MHVYHALSHYQRVLVLRGLDQIRRCSHFGALLVVAEGIWAFECDEMGFASKEPSPCCSYYRCSLKA